MSGSLYVNAQRYDGALITFAVMKIPGVHSASPANKRIILIWHEFCEFNLPQMGLRDKYLKEWKKERLIKTFQFSRFIASALFS